MTTIPKSSPATLYFDGGSRGNPGIAAGAAVLVLPDKQTYTVSRYLAHATNNEAEYTGLIIGLEKARELGLKSLKIHGDSQLVINHVKGTWKLKSENLRPLLTQSQKLIARFDRVQLEWIARAQNHLADAAANHCMDSGGKSTPEAVSQRKPAEKPVNDGETDLETLLQSMKPILMAGEFVFCSLSPDEFEGVEARAIAYFREKEGITAIIPRETADRQRIQYKYTYRQIALSVHSSLNAVGFLAVISSRLAEKDIPVNVISGYYHDHLFVPAEKVNEAMSVLRSIA
jgi:ribonuclease HI